MRRFERQINDFKELVAVVDECKELHLAMVKDNLPYVVPLNFGYSVIDDKITIYFHCAKEGKKIDILKANPMVCFSMFSLAAVKLDELVACKSTTHYKSIIGEGKVSFIDNDEDKFLAMKNIMLHYGYKGEMDFAPALGKTLLCKIEVTCITGKKNPVN